MHFIIVILDILDIVRLTIQKNNVSLHLRPCPCVYVGFARWWGIVSLFPQAGNFTVRLDLPSVTFQLLKLDVCIVLS